ncbi:MAG: YbaK/EbsC family protein, partial [bacterium]
MSIPANVTNYLTKAKVQFTVVAHRTVFTAYDLATTLREKLEAIGKTLLVKADMRYVLVVLPANRRLDLAKLKTVLQAKKLSIATEKDMVRELKVKPGALTPFGALHKIEVLADTTLLKTRDLLLGAGSFTESLRMKVKDFVRLENAK